MLTENLSWLGSTNSSESYHDDLSYFGHISGVLGDSIEVCGDWLPRHILGKCTAFCAILRMLYLTVIIVVRHLIRGMKSRLRKFRGMPSEVLDESDVVLMDGVSASLPLFFLAGIPSIFYCHFPDKVRAKLKWHRDDFRPGTKTLFSFIFSCCVLSVGVI